MACNLGLKIKSKNPSTEIAYGPRTLVVNYIVKCIVLRIKILVLLIDRIRGAYMQAWIINA